MQVGHFIPSLIGTNSLAASLAIAEIFKLVQGKGELEDFKINTVDLSIPEIKQS
jgi:hypothetical protein